MLLDIILGDRIIDLEVHFGSFNKCSSCNCSRDLFVVLAMFGNGLQTLMDFKMIVCDCGIQIHMVVMKRLTSSTQILVCIDFRDDNCTCRSAFDM